MTDEGRLWKVRTITPEEVAELRRICPGDPFREIKTLNGADQCAWGRAWNLLPGVLDELARLAQVPEAGMDPEFQERLLSMAEADARILAGNGVSVGCDGCLYLRGANEALAAENRRLREDRDRWRDEAMIWRKPLSGMGQEENRS